METDNQLLALHALASAIKLPAPWLRAESDAGRIPFLQAGRRRLYSLEAVRNALLRRAAEGEQR